MKNVGVAALVVGAVLIPAGGASAHRNGCHTKHTCPSDHATYRWQGFRCVKPGAPENNGSYRKRVRSGGLTYLCKKELGAGVLLRRPGRQRVHPALARARVGDVGDLTETSGARVTLLC